MTENNDLAASVREAVDERLAARLGEAARRRERRRTDRTRRAAARTAGLTKRHARKAALIANRSQEGGQPDPSNGVNPWLSTPNADPWL